jgi:DNA polymerase-1
MKTLLLVDGSSYLYRAFHAMPDLRTSAGEPVGALRGYINMLRALRDQVPCDYLACVFDAPGKTFRDEIFPEYKANRAEMPADLARQIPAIHEAVRALGWPVVMIEGIEADDVIGTLARKFAQEGARIVIVSGDKDLMQLVSERVVMIDTMKDKTYDIAGVEERFGVGPGKVAEILGLMGDTSDNIPGVPGVGPKRALELIKEYGTVEGVLENLQSIRNERLRNAIAEHSDQARLSRELATVKTDADVDL